jgi:hypothetical protein
MEGQEADMDDQEPLSQQVGEGTSNGSSSNTANSNSNGGKGKKGRGRPPDFRVSAVEKIALNHSKRLSA